MTAHPINPHGAQAVGGAEPSGSHHCSGPRPPPTAKEGREGGGPPECRAMTHPSAPPAQPHQPRPRQG
eukprot:2112092-Alexandrium_andersonii.AAC.1